MDDAILDNNFLTPSIVPIKKTQTPSILRTQEEPIPAKSILLDYLPPPIPANIPETSTTNKESVESSMDTEDEKEKRKRRRVGWVIFFINLDGRIYVIWSRNQSYDFRFEKL